MSDKPIETSPVWDQVFKYEGRYFKMVHEDIPQLSEIFKERNVERILDLGCGSGRHVIHFAKQGFEVFGLDHAPTGLAMARDWLANEELSADLNLGEMTQPLPYEDEFFDAIISIQVIHHARFAAIQKIVSELERVLKPNGFLFVTVPRQMNQAESFHQIEPRTFIPLDGRERGLPHHYFTPKELKETFSHFRIANFHSDKTDHYCLSALKISEKGESVLV